MIYAQIKNNRIMNTILLDDASLLPLFQSNPITGEAYDVVIRIDEIDPQPGIGWSYQASVFSPPVEIEEEL